MKKIFLTLLVAATCAASAEVAEPVAKFPGGNIRVERVEGTRVFVAPDLRDTRQGVWWFYWNLRVTSPAPSLLTFTKNNPIGVRGPAASYDGGATWRWLGARSVTQENVARVPSWSFAPQLPEGVAEARFAFCPSYLQTNLDAWLARHRGGSALRVEELCRSRKGRDVELLRAGCLAKGRARGVVLLTSRHHCCETMATFALEGLLDAVLAKDELGARWRENWEVVAVPFMDKDGCEDGDQGKNRAPRDHNRDYNERPIYPEVAAMMKLGAAMTNRVLAAVDLHCPHIRGEWNDRVYLVGAEDRKRAAQQAEFAAVWEREQAGPVKFRARDVLAFGSSWNTTNNYSAGRTFARWAGQTFRDARLATTIEIPFADALGAEVNAESARALGRDLAAALAEYLSAPISTTNHPVVGRWSAPIDGKPGFVREFRDDGGVSVWWPDGKLAVTGTFFVVGDGMVGARFADGANDTVKFLGPDQIQIDRVQSPGYFRRYFAERIR